MYKQNLHTHTRYCDGANSPEEMLEAAIAQGFDSIGFSGHAYVPFSSVYCMSKEGTAAYIDHITRLKKEYEGTVYYDRYILGRWVAAEGIIYRRFADDPSSFLLSREDISALRLSKISVGVDFGGNKSATAFVATGTVGNYESIVILRSELHSSLIDSDLLGELFCDFIHSVKSDFGEVCQVLCDNAEPILIRSLKKAARTSGLGCAIRLAKKSPVNDRIRLTCRLMAQRRFFICRDAESVKNALLTALYRQDGIGDERLDNGSTDIDSLDALEYSIERDAMKLIG